MAPGWVLHSRRRIAYPDANCHSHQYRDAHTQRIPQPDAVADRYAANTLRHLDALADRHATHPYPNLDTVALADTHGNLHTPANCHTAHPHAHDHPLAFPNPHSDPWFLKSNGSGVPKLGETDSGCWWL
jgi:hypothetical protein